MSSEFVVRSLKNIFSPNSKLLTPNLSDLSVLPMAIPPDPASPPRFPMARHPMGMRRWTSYPMAWDPNPIPTSMNPMPGSPNSIWIGGGAVILHPRFRWSHSDRWGWTSQEKEGDGAEKN